MYSNAKLEAFGECKATYYQSEEFSSLVNEVDASIIGAMIEDKKLLNYVKLEKSKKQGYITALRHKYEDRFIKINSTDFGETFRIPHEFVSHIRLLFTETFTAAIKNLISANLLIPNNKNVLRAASEAGVLQSIVQVGHSLNVDAPEFHPQEMEIVDAAEDQSSSARLNLETTNNTADIPIRKKDKKKNTNQNTSSDNK